ncbi:transcriptional regulator TetR family [Firmicutes bacterium CAG:582]|nr:transcriptional regulator TetR family [Firmicutes bacterium CAG:582]
MNKKDDLRVIKTRKLIYQTLLDLMKEKTFEEIKVSDICSKAMINRSTFYAHYEDKYELLIDFLSNLKEEFARELNESCKENLSIREYYIRLISLFLDHIDSKRDVYNSIMVNNRSSIMMDILLSVVNDDILKRFKENDINLKVPTEVISKFYLGGVINIGMEWLSNSNKYTKEEILDYLELLIPDIDYYAK